MIYNFMSLCLAYVGGPGAGAIKMAGFVLLPSWTACTCCMPPMPVNGRFVRLTKQMALQVGSGGRGWRCLRVGRRGCARRGPGLVVKRRRGRCAAWEHTACAWGLLAGSSSKSRAPALRLPSRAQIRPFAHFSSGRSL